MPGHHFAGGDVFYRGQVDKAILKRNVGDISAENLAGNGLPEPSAQFIIKCSMLGRLFHDRLVGIFSPDFCNEAILSHYPAYLFVVHDHIPLPLQMHFYLAPAVFLLAFIEDIFDQQVISMVLIRFVLLPCPPVVSAAGDAGNIAAKLNVFIQYSDDRVFLARP